MTKLYIDFEHQIYDFAERDGWEEREISTESLQALRDGRINIDYTKQEGDLSFFMVPEDEAEVAAREAAILEEQKLEFGRAVMAFFLAKMFALNSEQKITLMSIKTYFEMNGEFPPLEEMAKAEPELWAMVVNAVKKGDLPNLPEA